MRASRVAAVLSPATRRWAHAELKRRWRQLALLGLLAGVTCGLGVATYDGAIRTGSALGRFLDRTNATDAVVFASQSGVLEPDWTALQARPEVQTLARWNLLHGTLNGEPGQTLFVPTDEVWLGEVDRPIVLEGRMFDPAAPHEMVIGEVVVSLGFAKLGDRLSFQALGSLEEFGGTATGPTVEFTVVGVVRSSWQFLFVEGAWVSPGYVTAYRGQAALSENAVLSLREGTSGADIRAIVSDTVTEETPILDLRTTARRVRTSLGVERAILLAMTVAVVAVGAVLIGQAIVRSATDSSANAAALRAMGMTAGELIAGPAAVHALAAAIAIPVAVFTAAVASRWFPVALAARIDPDRGIQMPLALAVGAAVVVALLMVGVAAIAARAALVERSRASNASSRLSGLRRRCSLPIGLGTSMAFEARASGRSTGARAGLVGAAAALTGVVGVLTLTHGVSDAASHPERAGNIWDAIVWGLPADLGPADTPLIDSSLIDTPLIDMVASQPGLAAAVQVRRDPINIDGVGVRSFAFGDQPVGDSPIRPTLMAGRHPTGPTEIALGPATADILGVSIGDEVTLSDDQPATVVGLALFPTDVHSQYDEGAFVTWDRSTALNQAIAPEFRNAQELVGIRLVAGRHEAALAPIAEALTGRVEVVELAEPPPEIENLARLRRLPLVIAVFLLVVGAAAVGYGLASSVRRRRRDIAVWRALGMTTANTRLTIAAEATTVALFGIVIGVPLGVVAGRSSWKAISDRVPLAFVAPLALGGIALAVALALVIANVLAVLPARRAARLRPAHVLRTE